MRVSYNWFCFYFCGFHSADEQHLFNNMTVLIPNGYHVHRRFGRKHLLAAFFGGGIAGNLSQLCFYIFQQIQWKTVLPSPKSWGILGDFLGNKAEFGRSLHWIKFLLQSIEQHHAGVLALQFPPLLPLRLVPMLFHCMTNTKN